MPTYRISGLTVDSELDLPGVASPHDQPGPVDLTLRCRPVPEALDIPAAQAPFWQADGARFLLALPGIGRVLAEDGRTLDLEPEHGADPADALPVLLGTGLGAVLHQRGALVLHAATVESGGRAYAFCGRSGVGKSTLAAALCGTGCRLVADDVSAIVLDAEGRPAIEPDGRRLKLFSAPIRRLGLEARREAPVRRGIGKFHVAPPAGSADRSVPLAALYQLRRLAPTEPFRLARLSPLVAAQGILQDTYRPRLALAYAADGRAMAATAAVVRQVPAFLLARPEDFTILPETVAALRAQWDGLGD